jgi:hypothetical protein
MLRFVAIFALLLAPVFAQEGHPMTGTWHGSWGPDAKNRTDVTMVLTWDGKTISGLVNPGPDSVKLKQATLDPSQWAVHFELDMKDKNGTVNHVVVDGKIDDVTLIRRSIIGTWKQGNVEYPFKMTRDI